MNSKYVLALPLYRQEQELHRLGLPVSRQTMSNWVLTAGEVQYQQYKTPFVEGAGQWLFQ